MTKTLVEDLGCDTTLITQGPHGQKLVHFAAQFGHVSMLKYLVEERGCSPSVLNDRHHWI